MKVSHIFLIALGLTLGFILLTVLSGVLFGVAGLILSYFIGDQWLAGWVFLFAAGILWHWLPDSYKALHRSYEIRGEALVNAPITDVWDTVLPQPGLAYYSSTITKVTAVEGHPDRVNLHTNGEWLTGPLPLLKTVL